MLPQAPGQRLDAWCRLPVSTIAYVFMDAAGHINGTVEKTDKLLATEVGLFVDIRELRSERQALLDSFKALSTLAGRDQSLRQNPFVKPILDAIGNSETITSDPQALSEAVRNVRLPEAAIPRHDVTIMF